MEQRAEELRKKIAILNDVFGFTARHYINEKGAILFVKGLYVAITRDGWDVGSAELKSEIIDFVEKYDALQNKVEGN